MKKKLLLSLGLVITSLFVGSSVVKADQVNYKYSIAYFNNADISYISYINNINDHSSIINSVFSIFMEDYEDYKNDYPYYGVTASYDNSTSHTLQLEFCIASSLPSDLNTTDRIFNCNYISAYYIYLPDDSISYSRSLANSTSGYHSFFYSMNDGWHFNPFFFSNFDVYLTNIAEDNIGFTVETGPGAYMGRSFLIDSSANVPSIYELFEFTFLNDYVNDIYTTYNLNDYAYVILSFKDYEHLISPTYFDVKGQFCITSAFDYGQQPKETITDICSVTYSDYTPVRVYTSASDLQRHVIYYLKAYDTNITNSVKINTSIYNVYPITYVYADNPTIYVNGRPYSPIAYGDLPSTATGNTENGYVPGASCGIGDIDCVYETGGLDISDLFTHPLQLLQTVWGSITSVFLLITAFIALMPATLQVFLYSSFMLAIILGIIKIIIG